MSRQQSRQLAAGGRQQKHFPSFLLSAACCLLSALACKPKPWVPEAPPKPTPAQLRQAHIDEAPDDSGERSNLLNIARGAAVASRTAELLLENSAVRVIDGEPRSDWMSPAGDSLQTLTLSLGARCRIDHIGVRSLPNYGVKVVEFETSLDGKTFKPLATHTFERRDGEQMFDVQPVEALYLRATTKENFAGTADIQSILARGQELEVPPQRTISGCWSLNSAPAAFVDEGGTTRGFFDFRERMMLEGGFDGRVWRFVWTRGAQFGLIAMTLTPDSAHMSAVKFYIDTDPHHVGEDLLGDREPCKALPAIPISTTLRTYLGRLGYVPLYGLHFDAHDQLVAAESEFALNQIAALIRETAPRPLTLISRELRGANAAADRATAKARLDSLEAELKKRGFDLSRVKFVVKGRDDFRTAPWSEIMRTMQSGVELAAS